MSETKPTKAEVWKTIYANLLAYGLVPVNVRLHPADISVDIQLQPDQFDDVASALALFDLPSGEVWAMDNSGPHLWSKGEADEFYAWGRYCNREAQSKLLPGWNVSIYCNVQTENYPLPQPELDVPADPLAVASQQLRETTNGDEFAAAFGGFMTELGKAAEHEQGFHDDCDPARCADAEARVAELHGETAAGKADWRDIRGSEWAAREGEALERVSGGDALVLSFAEVNAVYGPLVPA